MLSVVLPWVDICKICAKQKILFIYEINEMKQNKILLKP